MKCLVLIASLFTLPLSAQTLGSDLPVADVYVLGEVHDNPAHHLRQAGLVAQIAPRAIVMEMISPDQARNAEGVDRGDAAAMATALGWEGTGWPAFSTYAPILAAAPDARLFGAAIPRDTVRRAVFEGAAVVFGEDAARFGLTDMDPALMAEMVEEQRLAHCDMLPPEMLSGMVEAQRLRDAGFAQVALEAFDATGGPVVVITGNGHARKDRGIPAVLARAAPGLSVWSLGQFEDLPEADAPYDATAVSDPAPREDPCLALMTNKG